jgi:hypothetical protein
VIAYYVHHVGRGHLHRAEAIARHITEPLTVLSSLAPPADWPHGWVPLPRDDLGSTAVDPTAGGRLHWAPRHDPGLQQRNAVIAQWIADNGPSILVSDVSVEVLALARLSGVPVAAIALPGTRSDPAHQLGYSLCEAIIAPWARLDDLMCPGLDRHSGKTHYVGGISRFDGRSPSAAPAAARRVLHLGGAGGAPRAVDAPRSESCWEWATAGAGRWIDDIWPELCAADVVVGHCGLGAIADIAAARRPAILIPEDRPHDEQRATARALQAAGLATVLDAEPPPSQWDRLLQRAAATGGAQWSAWSTGEGAARAARLIQAAAA